MTIFMRQSTLTGRHLLVARAAVVAAVCGAASAVPVPSEIRALPLLVFVIVGPGSAVMSWLDFPGGATMAGIVGISTTSMMALAAAMAWLQFWHPGPSCLVLAAVVAASGIARIRALQKQSETSGTW